VAAFQQWGAAFSSPESVRTSAYCLPCAGFKRFNIGTYSTVVLVVVLGGISARLRIEKQSKTKERRKGHGGCWFRRRSREFARDYLGMLIFASLSRVKSEQTAER